ncbi:MAG TPA: hypothetical protein VFQ38_03700 [Longimicrobiales bacterium]|nr:hypothetical protein [Longimicrobiales bacterium]
MRALTAAAAVAVAAPAAAQKPGDAATAAFAASVRSARAALHADAGRLWGARLDTLDWLGVAGPTVHLTRDPAVPGYPAAGGLWTGPLPAGIAPANTSVEWAGRRWAMVLLPAPSDSADAVRLLIHEASHVAQPSVLPEPAYQETAAGAALLDEEAGRLWLRLELRALAAALEGTGPARARAAARALLFRARRYREATPEERSRETALDVVEGLPEYTGWKLTGGRAADVAAAVRRADSAASYVRTFAYVTGPAYGYLLDAVSGPGWRRKARGGGDLQRLLAAALPAGPPEVATALAGGVLDEAASRRLDRAAVEAGRRFGADSMRAYEAARATARRERVARLRAAFVDGPTLRIRPGALRVSFDPRSQVPLADAGTVMSALLWKGDGGAELRAPDGALVVQDWSELRVPLGSVTPTAGALAAPVEWQGAGWVLRLPAGWVLRPAQGSWVAAPPPKSP